ncbi:hypothetical protein, partial [Caproiciproducens galactitolivorans]
LRIKSRLFSVAREKLKDSSFPCKKVRPNGAGLFALSEFRKKQEGEQSFSCFSAFSSGVRVRIGGINFYLIEIKLFFIFKHCIHCKYTL